MPGLLPVLPISMLCDQSSSASSIFGFVWPVDSCPIIEAHDRAAHGRTPYFGLGPTLGSEAALRRIDEATQVRPRFARIHSFLDAGTPPEVHNGEATARISALARTEVAAVALAYQFGISYDTYNLVADREVTSSLAPKGSDFLHAIGVMKSNRTLGKT